MRFAVMRRLKQGAAGGEGVSGPGALGISLDSLTGSWYSPARRQLAQTSNEEKLSMSGRFGLPLGVQVAAVALALALAIASLLLGGSRTARADWSFVKTI